MALKAATVNGEYTPPRTNAETEISAGLVYANITHQILKKFGEHN